MRKEFNGFRRFKVEVQGKLFEELGEIYKTGYWGFTLSECAEQLVCYWIINNLKDISRRFPEISWASAEREGYVPALPTHGRRIELEGEVEEIFGILQPRFGGMPRYIIERLPATESTVDNINQFYQKRPLEIILYAVEHQLEIEKNKGRLLDRKMIKK